jgi:ClpP class serine protease
VPKETLKSTVADGRVVTGREALAAKLVDQIGYVEDAYALARELGKAADAAVVKYRHEVSLFDAFGMAFDFLMFSFRLITCKFRSTCKPQTFLPLSG